MLAVTLVGSAVMFTLPAGEGRAGSSARPDWAGRYGRFRLVLPGAGLGYAGRSKVHGGSVRPNRRRAAHAAAARTVSAVAQRVGGAGQLVERVEIEQPASSWPWKIMALETTRHRHDAASLALIFTCSSLKPYRNIALAGKMYVCVNRVVYVSVYLRPCCA